jgi:MoxR-like ATPase
LTRPKLPQAPDIVRRYVAWGAGPRASQYLILGAKAWAGLCGRFSPNFDDVRFMAHPVLRHRIITNFTAEAEGIKSDAIIDELLKIVK